MATPAIQDASAGPGKPLSTEIMQNTNLHAVRTRVIELQGTIDRLKMAYQTHHDLTWPDVLSQFAVANAQIFTLMEDMKPILRNLSVFPSLVSAENATTLPILLSSKLLPQMEVEEASRKELQLAPLQSLPAEEQANYLKAQIEAMKQASDTAHKILTDGKKALGLLTRSLWAMNPQRDPKEVEVLKKQEAILRTAVMSGEGLRVTSSPHDRPRKLPRHLAPPGKEPTPLDEVAPPPLEDAGTKKMSPLVRTTPGSTPSPTLPPVTTPLPPPAHPSPSLLPSPALVPSPIPTHPPSSPAPPSTLGGSLLSGTPPLHPASPLQPAQVEGGDSLLGSPAGAGAGPGAGVGEVPLSLLQIQVQQRQQRQKAAGQQQRRW